MVVKTLAPAKINIGLSIGGIRDDGYHNIATVIQTVGLYDKIAMEEAPEYEFICTNFNFPAGEVNLCEKAYAVFCRATGIKRGVRIVLEKQIPVGAGLGGGSSDAGAVIVGLNRLWGCGLSPAELTKMAAEIGSDTAFFTAEHRGSALCRGRGEEVIPIETVFEGWVVIVFMGIHISTTWAYKTIDNNLTNSEKNVNLEGYILSCFPVLKGLNDVNRSGRRGISRRPPIGKNISERMDRPDILRLKNDFEPIVFAAHPELKEAVLFLQRQGASFSSLSGSGSAVFGLFSAKAEAEKAAKLLPAYPLKVLAATPAPNSNDLLQIN